MISRRVVVNLVAFAMLFVVLSSWAVVNVVKLDRIERPYEIVAEFESSPGLQPNVEATYLGVSIGSIDSVHLEGDHVRVAVDVNRGVELPKGISAAVRRKSAVGEPYLALDPPEDSEPQAMIDPGEGYTIPVERTTIPLAYGQLFASVDALVSAVPPEDLAVVLDELATALDGRGPKIREILASTEDLTTTLATRTETFDALARDLTDLTHTLASRHEGIGSAFDDLAALTDTLAASSADIEALMTEAPGFAAQVESLLDATYADLSCALSDVGTIFGTVGTPAHIQDLVALLQRAGPARDSLDSAMVPPGDGGADGWYLGGSFGIVESAPPSYPTPPTLPAPPALVPCRAAGAPDAAVPDDAGEAGLGPGGQAGPDGAVDVPGRRGPADPNLPDSTDKDVTDGRFPLWALVLAVAAGLLAALLASVRPWRWWAARRGGDSEDA